MSDAFIEVVGTGKKLQTYENTVAGESVHSEAVTPTDQNGTPFTLANPFPTSDSTIGSVNDGAVTTDSAGTLSAKLRGIVKILGDVWDDAISLFNVRIFQGDLPVSGANPLQVTGTLSTVGATLNIISALSATDYDLEAAAYSETTAISGPYKLNSVKLKFSNAAAKTISIYDDTLGTLIAQPVSTTAMDYVIPIGGIGFPDGRQIRIEVTQTSTACLMTLSVDIENGQLPMGGNPVLASPSEGTYIGDVGITYGKQTDAAGRTRVSQMQTLFDNQFQYSINSWLWDTITANGGTVAHVPNYSGAQLSVTSTAGSRAVLQSHQYMRYQPGNPIVLEASAIFGAFVTGYAKRAGLYGDNDGFRFELNETGDYAFVVRSSTSGSPVDVSILQDDWNQDTLDGSGGSNNRSGVDLNTVNVELVLIDTLWLSAGIVRFGFQISGEPLYVHYYHVGNILTVPLTKTANLPIRYECVNVSASSGSASFYAICQRVASEGGAMASMIPRSVDTFTTADATGSTGTRRPIVSIRPKATVNSITNRGIFRPLNLAIQTSGDSVWEVWYRPTLTGASWGNQGVIDSESIVEADIDATAITVTNALKIASGYLASGNNQISQALNLDKIVGCLSASGAQTDIVSVVVSGVSGTVNARAGIQWGEER